VILRDAPVPVVLIGLLLIANAALIVAALAFFKRLEPLFAENV